MGRMGEDKMRVARGPFSGRWISLPGGAVPRYAPRVARTRVPETSLSAEILKTSESEKASKNRLPQGSNPGLADEMGLKFLPGP